MVSRNFSLVTHSEGSHMVSRNFGYSLRGSHMVCRNFGYSLRGLTHGV